MAAALALATLLLPACITETRSPSTGLSRGPLAGPPGAIARPATARSRTESRVSVSLRPLGAVPFDGMVLPLVSPDGRAVAAQHGATPPWPVLLAQPGEVPPPGLVVDIFDLSPARAAGPEGLTQDLPPQPRSSPLPRGVLLGRSADARGFLIELPRRDGSRRLGLAPWADGPILWLTPDDASANAFATLAPAEPPSRTAAASGGSAVDPPPAVAFSRWDPERSAFDLVLAAPDRPRLTLSAPAGASYVLPTFGADPSTLFAFEVAGPAAASGDLALVALSVTAGDDPSPALRIISRVPIAPQGSIAAAFQAVAAVQTPWPAPTADAPASVLARGLAFLSPQTGSMVWFDAETGLVTPLATGTAGAAPILPARGAPGEALYLGTARALLFQGVSRDLRTSLVRPAAEAEVVAGPLVPRAVENPRGEPGFVLLGLPVAGGELRVGLMDLSPVPRTRSQTAE